ncbi:hypothetical protein TNCV_337211 [Trichonephila clavipes]|nr:hypothetical protein TNCV_337211 [Trichonephila clavipes]
MWDLLMLGEMKQLDVTKVDGSSLKKYAVVLPLQRFMIAEVLPKQNYVPKLNLRSHMCLMRFLEYGNETATAGSDVVQSGRPIFDDFFQHLWPYIGNNTANVVFQIVKRLWRIRID